jgi:hypothetical protein
MAAKQITVWGSNRPGNLARIAGAVAAKGVNIQGLFASDAKGGRSAVRLIVSNAGRAKAALKAAGYRVTEEPSVALSLPDKPGQLARAAARLSKARVNITYGYATVSRGAKRGTIVLGVSNAAAARRALR